MRISTVILPIHARDDAIARWQEAERLGFFAAYTYDHLSWRTFRDGPWYDALLTLTMAAMSTERIRLGTLVTTPNFRHPVTLAKDLMTLDEISRGRVTVGIGAGTDGFDAAVLGQEPLTPRDRAAKFAEFVALLDRLLTQGDVTSTGTYFDAVEARTIPGCVQRPRLPFGIAAGGPRGMALAARHGQAWITTGDPAVFDNGTAAESLAAIKTQLGKLEVACESQGRDPASIERILLTGFLPGNPLESMEVFEESVEQHAEAGITEVVIHAPIQNTQFALDQDLYAQIASEFNDRS